MDCQTCKERLYPTNPEIGMTVRGKYLFPLCHSCPNSIEGKRPPDPLELEERIACLEKTERPRISLQEQTYRLNYIEGLVKKALRLIESLLTKKKDRI